MSGKKSVKTLEDNLDIRVFWKTDDAGNPIPVDDIEEWALWWGQPGVKKVAEDFVGGVHVSTVFLGMSYGDREPNPDLWETMVFGGKLHGTQKRYSSLQAAMEGHGVMLRRVMAAAGCAGAVKK